MSAAPTLTPKASTTRGPRARRVALSALPAVVFVVAVFVLPFLAVARVAVAGPGQPGSRVFFDLSVWSPGTLAGLVADPLFASVVGVTLRLALIVTVVCLALALPYAAYVHLARGWRKGVLLAAVVLPKLVNLLVLLYGVLLILGRDGFLNRALLATGLLDAPLPLFGNLPAVVFTEVLVVLPYPLLVLVAAFHAADPRHAEAARSLGAGPLRAYLETVVRPALPAVVSAGLICAVWAAGAFVGPLVLGNPPHYTVAVEVYDRALERLDWVDAAGWALLSVAGFGAALGAVTAIARRVLR